MGLSRDSIPGRQGGKWEMTPHGLMLWAFCQDPRELQGSLAREPCVQTPRSRAVHPGCSLHEGGISLEQGKQNQKGLLENCWITF